MTMRDTLMNEEFFLKWIPWQETAIAEDIEYVKIKPASDSKRRAQFIFQLFIEHYTLLIRKFSRGDELAEIKSYLPEVIKAWEWAYEEEIKAFTPEEMDCRKNFARNYDYYVICFWLASLGILLDIEDDLFRRMLKVIGNEGRDALFDRLIATRIPERPIGEKLLYPRPYQPLYASIDATADKQQANLSKFLKNWYPQMKRTYWHDCHNGPDGGGYFGYWCFEAAGVVKAFGIDDSSFRDMPYYPKDLVHWRDEQQ